MSQTRDIVIYTTRGCPYCVVAKRALDGRGIPYREVDITFTPEMRDELKAKTGEWTVPQVFVDGVYIGQDDELVEMVESGELETSQATPAAAPGPPPPGLEPAWDVAIVGAGVAGLSLARLLAPSGPVLVLDRAPHVPGRDPARDALRADAEAAGATLRQEEVFGLEPGPPGSGLGHGLITLDAVLKARTVVVATGLSDRTPALPGEAALHGKGVSLCAACDAPFFKGLPVAVLGSDERAAHAALLLAEGASRVTLASPEPALTAAPATLERLRATPGLEVRLNTRPRAILGETHATGLELDGPEGPARLEVSGVFVYLPGDRPGTGFLHGQAATAPDGALTVSQGGETSLEGLFAVGKAASGGADLQAVLPRLAAALARRLAAG
jgi:thioredoxin reductase (NADPH)